MNGKKICFVLDHKLHHYRIPFFKKLSQKGYIIDIYHIGTEISFNEERVKEKLISFSKPLNKLLHFDLPSLQGYSVVIFMQNLRLLNLWSATLSFKRKSKIIHWGIGVSSSRGLPKNKNLISFLRDFLSNYADALVFYSEFPVQFFNKKNKAKSFIAHNTIVNRLSKDFSSSKKDSFLFIGSLNERKGLDVLLLAFKEYLSLNPSQIKYLNIVGDGKKTLVDKFKQFVQENNLSQNVRFVGALYDENEKRKYFESAVACISPKQAGLSVLESFSFGVPFICFDNAISGGEHLNIKNGFNGYLVKSKKELISRMLFMVNNEKEYRVMGRNSYEFFSRERSMDEMVSQFDAAIKYATEK